MNWLAHLYLSDSDPRMRIGSLLPDFVPASSCASLQDEYQRGIRLHCCIDAFTDAHPIVRQSVMRFRPPLRRFGGILTDVFYDHFLARDWSRYSSEAMGDFIQDVYRAVSEYCDEIPEGARVPLERMRHFDWLNSYRELSGVGEAVGRIGLRFERPIDLSGAMTVFEEHYERFAADFSDFFPELCSHVSEYLAARR